MVERHQVELYPPNGLVAAMAEALRAYARYTVARAVSIEASNQTVRGPVVPIPGENRKQ